MAKNPKRPRDPNQLAALIAWIATGEVKDNSPDEGKNPAAVARGKKGGLIGGKARATKLTAAQRKKIAKKAIKTRWAKD
ncbi:MAG: histone H1 [Alphaproteobacteria bacterium]|nr:histone H1 [Alphaproteobacteria bacterium]NDC56169.1 histone H1 [Alphaproteobacteria bacterium]NDG05186.1 histone H1 [Alphaproteobacteria bacterium]